MQLIRLTILIWILDIGFSSKEDEGYPQGYLSECEGVTKPAKIKQSHLKYIGINTVSYGSALTAKLTRYSYHQTRLLAKDKNTDFTKKTMLFVGGYLGTPTFVPAFIGTLYKRLGYNVWSVDMNYFVLYPYPVSARVIQPVCKHLAEMLANLTKSGLDPKKLELVGVSLGGQSMSFIAKRFRELTGTNLTRLTGLDPSGPCFRTLGPEWRLDKSDADFVDVIHTNIDGYGMAKNLGHVDFYVNGGEFQLSPFPHLPCTAFCSHIWSFTIWLASLLNPDCFIGVQCDSVSDARERKCFDGKQLVTNSFGLNTDRTKPGIYYLATKNTFPYCIGKQGLDGEYDMLQTAISSYNKEDMMIV